MFWLSALLSWLLAGICYVLYLLLGDSCSGVNWILASPATAGLSGFIPCLDINWQHLQESNALQPIYTGYTTVNNALQGYCSPNAGGPIGAGLICNPIIPVPGMTGFYMVDPAFPASCFTSTPQRVPPSLNLFNATNPGSGVYNPTNCPGFTPQLWAGMVRDTPVLCGVSVTCPLRFSHGRIPSPPSHRARWPPPPPTCWASSPPPSC